MPDQARKKKRIKESVMVVLGLASAATPILCIHQSKTNSLLFPYLVYFFPLHLFALPLWTKPLFLFMILISYLSCSFFSLSALFRPPV